MAAGSERPVLDVSQVSNRLWRGWLGRLVLRPGYDRVSLGTLIGLYFPLSRAWAAALAADGSAEAFRAATGRPTSSDRAVAPVLATVMRRRDALARADAAWRAALFGDAPVAERIAAERARLRAAHRLSMARGAFLRPHVRARFEPVRWDVPDEASARASYAGVFAAPHDEPPTAAVEESHVVPTTLAEDRWLRFAAPSREAGGDVLARVSTPYGADNPPTLVFAHGVCIEDDYWQGAPDLTQALLRRGVRIVRAEAPWHGRRRLPGWYGGEPVMGRGPLGIVELVRAWSAELAVLLDWARATSAGPVAVGGVSLGALTAQRLATDAARWPAARQPDALFLVATSGDLAALAANSVLVQRLGLPAQAAARGWTPERLADWLPLAAPVGAPAMPPDRVVMVLGRADDLVPYAGGSALAEAWAVPPENLFVRPQGHFSVSLGLITDPAPQQAPSGGDSGPLTSA